MTTQTTALVDREHEVRSAIDELIETATTYDVATLDRIYHDDLHVVMIDTEHNLETANKDGFKALFDSKRAAGDPPMNTWAKYHDVSVDGDTAHVLLSRKNDLSGVDMDLTLSIDLVFEDDRWQVIREVITLRPDDSGTETVTTVDRAEFSAYNDRYNEIIESYDLEAFVGLYRDTPVWIAPNEPAVAGLDVPRATFEFIVENQGALTHTFDDLVVSDDGSQAVMVGTYKLNVEKADASADGTYLFVLQRDGKNWRIAVDMFNQYKHS